MREDFIVGRTVHHVFTEQAKQTPQAIAVDGPCGALSYDNLARRSDCLAGALHAAGVKPGDIVAVGLERGVDVVAAFLAIFKVGAAYCCIDLADPPARHKWTLEDCRPTALITTRALDDSFSHCTAPRIYPAEISDGSFPPPPEAQLDGNAAACVMYTSGSTGRPKAALIPHRGIVRLFAEKTFVPFGPNLRMLAHSPMHFDAITYEVWGPLLHGGTSILFGGGPVPSLHSLRDHISRYAVNTLFFGPALFNLIVDEDVHLLDGVQTMLVGGDALSAGHIRKAQAHLPHTRFVNAYGPTEATTFAAMYDIPRPFSPEARSVPIGTAITRTSLYVLNENREPVKDGDEGQLFIGGDGVALGYLNLPDLTAERFVPDPFANDPAARMYGTGDLCVRLRDGNIDFLGRVDGQVKIGGRRIELGEIEHNVQQYPGVLQAVAVILEVGAEKHIVGYYVSQKAADASSDGQTVRIDPADLRRFLADRLPSYLVPRDLVEVEKIPRKANGKIDRRALPPPVRTVTTRSEAPAKTPEEALLIDLWKQVLGEQRIGAETCFYEAGGTSLGAVRLCCAIERRTDKFIDIGVLAAHSTPRKLAVLLREEGPAATQTLVQLNADSDSTNLFCISGHIWRPRSLQSVALHLDGVATVLSVALPGLDAVGELLRDTRATARYALEQIRSRQPTGPYHLLGYSYGGVVAFEIASQLQAMGEKVGALVLLDAHLCADGEIYKTAFERAIVHTRQLMGGGPTLLFKRLRERRSRLSRSKSSETLDQARHLVQRAQQDCQDAYLSYQPGRYAGDALLLCPEEPTDVLQFTREEPMNGWPRAIAGQIRVRKTPGSHLGMINEPHAAAVAARVRDYLLLNTSVSSARSSAEPPTSELSSEESMVADMG